MPSLHSSVSGLGIVNMNTQRLTEKQCITIISNNYLGAPNKQGKQKDYHDYIDAINARLWALQDKRHRKIADGTPEWVTEAPRPLKTEPMIDYNKIFNKWRYLSQRSY